DAPHAAAAVESVCNSTDTGTTSTPRIRWKPGYGLASGFSHACHRCTGGVVATPMCSPSSVPDRGADTAASICSLMVIQCCAGRQAVVSVSTGTPAEKINTAIPLRGTTAGLI